MNTVGGYAISSWERGYGDMEFVLDERTIRVLTHLPATAMVQCDLVWLDHAPVVQSLALQPALHVGEGEHDGVDLVALDHGPQPLEGEVAVVGCAHRGLPWSCVGG